MSANKELARRMIEAIGKGDAAGIAAITTDDFIADTRGSSVLSIQRPKAVVLQTAELIGRVTENGIRFDIQYMIEEGDRIACHVKGFSRLRSGVDYNNEYVFIMTFKNGRIAYMAEFLDTRLADQALAPMFAA